MKIHQALSTVALAAIATGCVNGQYVHFNRDALWDTSLACCYCTYDITKVRNGMVFCHVNDLTTQNLADHTLALTVEEVLEDDCYVLKIPYLDHGDPAHPRPRKPVVVKVLKGSPKYKVGDVFTNWGQYKVRGTANGKVESFNKPVLYLTQINSKNEHVFEEPFIDYGQCSR